VERDSALCSRTVGLKFQGTYNYEGTTSSLRYYYLLPNPAWGSATNWLLHCCMLYCNNRFTGSEYQYFTDPVWGTVTQHTENKKEE